MNAVYERDLDLNLLRVFAVVADEGSVTRAAARLYLTQPAVSAALRRLSSFVGVALFAREGRGLVLTGRGAQLFAAARLHLEPLVAAAMEPAIFEPRTSTATIRLGLAESTEGFFLAPLLAVLREEAPAMQVVILPVQFRTVEETLASRRADMAVSVADELPPSILRRSLMSAGFVCVYDPQFARVRRPLTEADYFAHEHIIVSYAGDLRGVIEDTLGKSRKVRLSVPAFSFVGDTVAGSSLLATVPEPHARQMLLARPHLRAVPLPFPFPSAEVELLWPRHLDEDPASKFVRGLVEEVSVRIAREVKRPTRPRRVAHLRQVGRG
jgi:LysR family transcriptional regulator, mexEF-oprN operon transcriptional activator